MLQEYPEPSAPALPRQPVGGRVSNGTYPPLPNVSSPFPRASQPESPREQPRYFVSRSEAGAQPPMSNGNGRSSFVSSDVSSTSYRPGRSNTGSIKSEPLPSMEVTVADPRVSHEPHKVAVPGRCIQPSCLVLHGAHPVAISSKYPAVLLLCCGCGLHIAPVGRPLFPWLLD